MCVILDIDPNFSFPKDKLEIACEINKDGFGLSWIDKGRIQVLRDIAKNDPDKIAKELERLQSQRRFLHLRHATVGSVCLDNSHPFRILDAKDDGMDLFLMHNGTLSDYRPQDTDKKSSDTSLFVYWLVRPLLRKLKIGEKPDKFLMNPLLSRVLKPTVGFSSVVLLYDAFGNQLIINENKGKQFEGFWASNDYSFQTTHARYGGNVQTNFPGYNRDNWNWSDTYGASDLPWERYHGSTSFDDASHEDEIIIDAGGAQKNSVERLELELAKWSEALLDASTTWSEEAVMITVLKDLNEVRRSFNEMTGLTSVDDIGKLTRQDLVELCEAFPQASAEIIIALLAERTRQPRRS